MKTYIPGKDAALEDSINFFQQQLQQFDLEIDEISWLNPVANVWSVHIQNRQCPLCFTNGKGATKKAALASALGEYFERLSTNYFFSDFYLGETISHAEFVHYPTERWFKIPDDNSLPSGLLDEKLWDFYDPERNLCGSDLIDLSSSNNERGICALPFIHQDDQQVRYVPVNLLDNLYASNGMAAGNSCYEARVQALSEIFERYVKNRVIGEALSLPLIPQSVLARYPQVLAAIDDLQRSGYPILCYDASLGGIYPVIAVVLFNPQTGGCYASFGAHPDFGVALERTVTELLQGRDLQSLDGFAPPTFDNHEVADLTNLETHFIDSSGLISWDLFREQSDFDFVDWHFSGTTEQEFQNLMAILQQQQIPVLIMDYQYLGVYACRILAVGLSEIYPPEDLLIANNNMAIDWRQTIVNLPQSQLRPVDYLTTAERLDHEDLDDFARVRELLGIAPEHDSAWYSLRIGELKAMLYLAAGEIETAHDWLEWTLNFNASTFNPQRLQQYRCLLTLLNLVLERGQAEFADYRAALEKMYGAECVALMWQVLQGKVRFMGLETIDGNLTQFAPHQQLLAVKQKLMAAQQKQA